MSCWVSNHTSVPETPGIHHIVAQCFTSNTNHQNKSQDYHEHNFNYSEIQTRRRMSVLRSS
jgi:hypothetical protein